MRGFSLVELSIVLVILGLLVGGVMAGQSLVRAAELRAVGTEYQRWVTVIQGFRGKYFAIPGDMLKATDFWGIAAGLTGDDATCRAQMSTDGKTCNGNGDGMVVGAQSGNTVNESFRFWQHLANAGLIEGSYIGVTDGANVYSATVRNVPGSRIRRNLWHTWNWSPNAFGSSEALNMIYGNTLVYGGSAANTEPGGVAALTPQELWNIDRKLDDGKPGRGKLIARLWNGCTDAANQFALDAAYRLADNSKLCTVMFRQAY